MERDHGCHLPGGKERRVPLPQSPDLGLATLLRATEPQGIKEHVAVL